VLDTCCCIGSPLALNALALRSPFGLTILVPVLAFHVIAFVAGYYLAVATFPKAADRRNVARTVSFEIGECEPSGLSGHCYSQDAYKDPDALFDEAQILGFWRFRIEFRKFRT
jgi:hypothetical protein